MSIKSPLIACISHPDDAHISLVQKHLSAELITLFGLDAEKREGFSFLFKKGTLSVLYRGRNLEHVKSVWYRKPEIKPEYIQVTPGYERYALSAVRTHANAVLSLFQDSFWVSDYFAILRASSKPFQQIVAQKVGFLVPDTLTTSSSKAAQSFLDNYETIVVKSQMAFPAWQGSNVLDFPTTLARKGQKIKLEGLHLAPAIFQQAIDVDFELRVTVVGKEVFAASIRDWNTKGMPKNVRDWRMNYVRNGAKFEPHTLTKDMANKCRDLVKQLGLQFGAIDLIVDKKGKIWFLEINPNGQWAFIEDDADLPIGKAIAELLERG